MHRRLQASQSNFQKKNSQIGLEQKGQERGPIPLPIWEDESFWNSKEDCEAES